MSKNTITIARGDGIGHEIMDSTLQILEAANVPLEYDEIKIGKEVYESGVMSGISPESWDTLAKNKVFLKAPITTPQGSGYKSLNVTIRKTLGLFANVRPVKALVPYVRSNFPTMDVVVVRENEEDLYAGIEHQQTPEVVQCLKLVSRPGCERVIRYAFEYAKAYDRNKVTCMTKDNIMKHTDGLFHEVFDEVRKEYPEIESDHYIIDIGAARLADTPQWFDVVVTLNLYGDIISDITGQISGSVGLGGSGNIGNDFAMFEAIHGSAPDIAGKDVANPSGLINGACMMLAHLNLSDEAELISNALLATIEQGIHTADIKSKEYTKQIVGTKDFTKAVIDHLGERPKHLKSASYGHNNHGIQVNLEKRDVPEKKLVGVDVFIDWTSDDRNPDDLGKRLDADCGEDMKLKMITNRGVKVYPEGRPETFCTDHWRCRFIAKDASAGNYTEINGKDVIQLLSNLNDAGHDCIKTENLYEFDGKRGFSLGQGE
ncbi:NADP-dependent isocitrate dehydrogenase [Balneola sp. MJW-20]|uniref:NADP-dependent isocitrate dehydrogenase n=1 Tax=Gracilimonas aurantiaca TaxID=3234185 RepID=UPI0034678D87